MKSILITGAPGSGKTTLARNLAAELGYQCFGTDIIREIARVFVPRSQNPWFHTSAIMAGKYAPKVLTLLFGHIKSNQKKLSHA
ncbi:MAG: AAA family ATPase [Patescibacteria group bacterium]